MNHKLFCAFVLVLISGTLVPGRAEAGAVTESADIVSITPIVGVEIAQIGSTGFSDANGVFLRGLHVSPALTYGAIAGVRLGPFGLGVLYQHTQGGQSLDSADVTMNKLYGQLSLQIPWDKLVGLMHIDVGWASLATPGTLTHGVGGTIGAALDFYPVRLLSIGAGADFDLQGYRTPGQLVGGYGGTFVARIGLHL